MRVRFVELLIESDDLTYCGTAEPQGKADFYDNFEKFESFHFGCINKKDLKF